MEWTFKSGQPIYTQIAGQLRMRIANGKYEPGEQLPPVRELAVEAGVNPNTMQRALAEMEREGLLYTERTNGRFITKEEKILSDMRKTMGEEFIRDLFENLQKIGMDRDEIVKAVDEWAKGVN